MNKKYTVGIVGGGVSGTVTALELAEQGIDSILFEKKENVVNGPPFCHLHAGGNLYPDISDEQCRILMKQSIEMAKMFPESIDRRPTFISIPKTEKYEFNQIEDRLKMLVTYYKQLIIEDTTNEILGKPDEYYKIYNSKELSELQNKEVIKTPSTPDEWMVNTVHIVDLNKLKTPVILVQEYGWNLFRLGAHAQLAIEKSHFSKLQLNTAVTNIIDTTTESVKTHNWEIETKDRKYQVDYLVNACGFRTGDIDEDLKINMQRLIEFKAAYISKWKPIDGLIPELIFHGERGTPHGMAQLTPYCEDFYQIHGMTEDITLFKNGLVQAEIDKVQPEFNEDITNKLENGWKDLDTNDRTKKAINYIANFVPTFESASVGGPPLFGAQQIPGNDPTLRVGEVSFPSKFYARSEIVKASSALTVAKQIIERMKEVEIIKAENIKTNNIVNTIKTKDINELATVFAEQRKYPKALSRLVIEQN